MKVLERSLHVFETESFSTKIVEPLAWILQAEEVGLNGVDYTDAVLGFGDLGQSSIK